VNLYYGGELLFSFIVWVLEVLRCMYNYNVNVYEVVL
jgi:hypothetical protein